MLHFTTLGVLVWGHLGHRGGAQRPPEVHPAMLGALCGIADPTWTGVLTTALLMFLRGNDSSLK